MRNINYSIKSISKNGTSIKNVRIKKVVTLFITILMISSFFFLLINMEIVKASDFEGGDGSIDYPYQITKIEHLWNVRNNLTEYFILMDDLDFNDDDSYLDTDNKAGNTTGGGWSPIGNNINPFAGHFNGNNHTISNLFIDRDGDGHVGLFGYIGSGSDVYNIGLVDANVTANNVVGGLVGRSEGSISESYVTGNVTGLESVGGLAGDNSGDIFNSSAIVDVEGDSKVGGFVGVNRVSISNSYSTGSVTGSSSVGGFVGENLDSVSNCFWDTETSGTGESDGGTGKTTTEMMDIRTFSDAGWDIVEIADWAGEAWFIDDGNDYPRLWSPPAPSIIYVDDDNTEGPWDGTVDNPYQYIQDGIDNASAMDTIYVYNGTYYEHINIDKVISLIGENCDNTVIDKIGNPSSDCVSINANNVNISGFTIKNASGYGIEIYGYDSCNITNNNIMDYGQYGICIEEESNNNIINSNIISGGYFCILIVDGSSSSLITENTLQNASDSGLYIQNGCDNNEIYNNNFISNNWNARDYGASNLWDNGYPFGGNYWDDFDDADEGAYDNDSDGIVDSPYAVIGGSSQDLYPLINPYGSDIESPVVIINSPENGTIFTDPDITIVGYAIDNVGIVQSGYSHIWDGQGIGGAGLFDEPILNWSFETNFTLRPGNNSIRVYAKDAADNRGEDIITVIYGGFPSDLYVDDNNTEGPWDGTLYNPYQYIQDAIDASEPEDIIFVFSGTYYENVIVDKSITLQGEDKNTTIIDGSEDTIVVQITADNVNLSNFTIQNASDDGFFGVSYGIYTDSNHTYIYSNIVKDNNAWLASYGITIYNSNNNTISNNVVFNNSNSTVGLGYGIFVTGSEDNNIHNNTCYNDVYGITLTESLNCNVVNNILLNYNGTVLNNSFFDLSNNITIGVICYNCININISNNEFLNTSLFIFGNDSSYYYQNVYDNLVNEKPLFYSTNNSDLSIPLDVGQIILVNYTNFVIENKMINYTTLAINLCYSDNIIIRNSTVNNSYIGIYQIYSDNCSIYNNTFMDNTMAIELDNCYNNDIFHNNFLGNYYQAYDYDNNNWYNSTLNQGNYWDDYNGTDANNDGIGDSSYDILMGSNQDPYPLMYERTIPPSFVWVDDDYNSSTPGWNVDHFDSIQKAIDNITENGMIYVYNATYYENVVVDKSINLFGQDKNTTIIDGGGSGDVVYISADWVNISGFTIQNGVYGIESYSGNNTISGNIIKNNSEVGIYFEYSDNNIISGNIIKNNSYYGIILGYSSNNTISDNTLNSNTLAAIYFEGSSENYITKCDIYDNPQYGIYLYDLSNNNTIYHNNFNNNTQNANDSCTNTWYNATLNEGNYWDDYLEKYPNATGSNGIWDTPYNITGSINNDSYPLFYEYSYYYDLIISAPSQVNEGSNFVVSVSTPSGAILPAVDVIFNLEVHLTSTGQITLTAPSVSSDTVYQINVTASGYNTNTSLITVKNVPSSPSPPSPTTPAEETEEENKTNPPTSDANGPYEGLTFENFIFDGSGSSDNGTITNYTWSFGDGISGYGVKPVHSYSTSGRFTVTLTVTDNDGLTGTDTTYANITLDTDGDGWSDAEEIEYGSNETDYNDTPLDTDNDTTPDVVDEDDDNDGVPDQIEDSIGSNSKDSSDVKLININGSDFYLIDSNNDSVFDCVYNPTGRVTDLGFSEDGRLLLNIVGDEKWDYYYDPQTGAITLYQEEPESPDDFPWIIWIIILIILIVLLIIFILYKKGYIVVEKKDE